ncbi:rotatin [Denticeps clupeoides]|uniref:rotatin n=1 Tax=Denticeps clupeoides TaxID=299321 RepID=UPI0010A43377|nr:rotatin [Denticeps clupeoides]
MDLSALIRKTGHSLVEIRVRALRNIKSKLDHGLLGVPDLVQERQLFVLLLEWFNFPEVPEKEVVLDVLCSLSKHPTGAHMLRDVGAVEFLTQLSPNVEEQLRGIIDSIFDQLFHLPETLPNCTPASNNECQFANTLETGEEPPVRGYFKKSGPVQTDIPPLRAAVNSTLRCLKFSTFPWLSLTPTDRHILSSNESSLRSNNQKLVWTTCELLCDVIMQDFPAEIFLQRPSIVQGLLSLLRFDAQNGSSYIAHRAVSCMRQLCTNLRSRLRFHRDPSFCSSKQDPISQNSSMSYSREVRGTQHSVASSTEECSPRPSVVGRTGQRVRGDGQDGDTVSSSGSSSQGAAPPRRPLQSPMDTAHLEGPELEGEDLLELQMQQWNLTQFCVATLEHTLPLLRTERLKEFQRAVELLSETALLLGASVSEELWDDPSLFALELKERLQECLETLADILSYHSSRNTEQSESLIVHHRMAYMATAIFTIRLLQALFPGERAAENMPESVVAAIFQLCLDSPFSEAFPTIHETAVAYLEMTSSDSFDLFRRVTRAAHSLEATCAFLKEAQSDGEKNWLELLELGTYAVDGFPFHQHLPVVIECVQMCSYMWKFAQASPLLRKESQKIFLKLLAYPLLPVKAECYTCTLNLVKDSLGIQNVTRPVSSVSSGVHFVLHERVLYEICTFGLQDQAEKVNSAAKDILLYLLKGRLMMTAETWSKFNEAIYPVIPVLQSYAGTEDALGNCILLISEASDEAGDWICPRVARLRAALRLLFTKHKSVRTAAVQHLVPHLTNTEGARSSRPALESSLLKSLPSLYDLSRPVDLKLDDSDTSFLKVESVNKLYGVLTSETVDLVLRRSAAEQLLVVLQDTTLHAVLKNLGVTEKLISFITDIVNNNVKNMDCLLEPSVSMLRKLVYADPSLRHSLAGNQAFLLTLLRASLIIKESGQGDVSEAAALMCLLLFDEIARADVWSDHSGNIPVVSPFSLPASVIRRYSLPFQSASHHVVSPYCSVLAPYADLLTLRSAWEMLQVSWNRAWHSGIDHLVEQLRGHQSDIADFHGDLHMSATQGVVLRTSDIRSGLQDCVQAILSAGSHAEVGIALARMKLYLLTDRLALKHTGHNSKATLQTLSWHPALERFLLVQPACSEDEKLLVEVVSFLNMFFSQNRSNSDSEDLRWTLELLLNQEPNTLLNLVLRAESPARSQMPGELEEPQAPVARRLQRELTGLFNTLLLRLGFTCDSVCMALAGALETQLANRLLQCLRVSDAPHFYGLPSLERTLRAMAHVSALPGWSTHCPSLDPHMLCVKYLTGLLEVISSFYVEWGGNSMSFMGKGVTKNAVICLLHLSHEMMAESKDKDWMSLWSLPHEQSADEQSGAQLGLAWLVPLWVDRDPEVRCASLGVGSALSSVASGCQALSTSCQNISGGLWGTLLNILLEPQESSMVRREAAFILQNLLVMPMPANTEEAKNFAWQGPCVHDDTSGLALVGLPALQALLYHCQFFEHVAQMTRTCYLGRQVFSSSLPRISSGHGDLAEELNESLRRLKGPSGLTSQNRASSSVSTSSTLLLPGGSSELHPPASLSSPSPAHDAPVNRLTAQGQSDLDSGDSVVSQVCQRGDEVSEQNAVVTPPLVTALCGVLTNLLAVLPEFTLTALTHNHILHAMASLLDAGAVERCVTELKTPALLPGDEEEARNQVQALLQYVGSFSKLLQGAVVLQPDIQLDFLQPLLAHVFILLTIKTSDLDAVTVGAVFHTWAGLFMLLATLLRRKSSAVFPSVSAAMGRHWQPFLGTICLCVDQGSSEVSLCTSALHFLCVLLSVEAQRQEQEMTEPCPDPRSRLVQLLVGSPGEQLCELLLQKFEKTLPQDPLKKVIARALMSLLASSPSAQTYACEAGLIDSTVEQMKLWQTQLNLGSLRPGKPGHKKKQEESNLRDVKTAMEIVRNCLYQHNESKAAATDSRLASVIHSLWPWLLLDDDAMAAALELLCVYTANCSAACSSLCSGGSGASSGQAVARGHVSNSLMHAVMRLASQVASENSRVQAVAFSLLSNVAITRDGKGLLHKSNFLQHFLSLPLPRSGSKSPGPLVSLWLQLLLNMSFDEDGQQMIVKLNGSLELLVALAQYRRPSTKPVALLILHNICFSPANKAKVLASGKTVGLLASCLDSNLLEVRAVGASALWALLHNYQKAKVTLKDPSFRFKIDDVYAAAKREAEQKMHDPLNAYLFKCLEKLKQILSA